jgi:hypothetical protein
MTQPIKFITSKIKLMMDLSDPDKMDKPVALTSSILYNTELTHDGLTEFPYFTPDINYPLEYLHTLDYDDRIHFFFNKEIFERILNNKATFDSQHADKITDDKITKSTFFDHNTKVMIDLIFPTVFPHTNNNDDSYHKIIVKGSSVYDYVMPNFFRTHRHYSYLKLDSKINTVLQTIQANDFINHPKYRKLLKSYIKFKEWIEQKKVKIDDDIKQREDKIRTLIKKQTTRPSEKVQLLKYLSDLNSLISKSASSITRYDVIERDNQYIQLLITSICTLFGIKSNTDDILTLLSPPPPLVINSLWITKNITFTDLQEPFEILESIRDKISKPPRNINIPSSLINLLKPLLEESKKNYVLKKVKNKYFGDEININTSNEDDDDLKANFTETNYTQYFGFIKDIKLLIAPNLESTNRRLQKMIYNYSQSTDQAFSEYLDYIHNKYLENIENTNFPLELYTLLPEFDADKDTIEILLMMKQIISLMEKQLKKLEGYKDQNINITEIIKNINGAITKLIAIEPDKSISKIFGSTTTSGIIHDLNNSLKLITGQVENLESINIVDIKLPDPILEDLKTDVEIIQKSVNDLTKKTENNTSKIKQEFIDSLNGTNFANHSEILYVGVNSTETTSKESKDSTDSKEPKYQIVLLIDVAMGEVNDSNKNDIKCNYFSNDLDKRYKLLQNKGKTKWEVGARGFFDIEKNSTKHVEKEKEKELNEFKQTQQKIQISQKVPITNQKVRQGGYKKTYKKRNISCKRNRHKLTMRKTNNA